MKSAATALAAVALALPAARPVADAVRYVEGRQAVSGGFAEPGGQPAPALTAWALLGLRAAGTSARALEPGRAYLEREQGATTGATGLALVLLARAAAGERPRALVERVRSLARASGAIGPTVNSTIWSVIALAQAGEAVPPATVRYLLHRQTRAGGWSWTARAAPDSNDTAAAVQALRAAGVSGRPITRALRYLRRLQNRDGGFELTAGRGSDVQSTAWSIQAYLAADRDPGRAAYAYLLRMRRADGSLRYSARYATTPVWVTAQALPALARKPFPLR